MFWFSEFKSIEKYRFTSYILPSSENIDILFTVMYIRFVIKFVKISTFQLPSEDREYLKYQKTGSKSSFQLRPTDEDAV